jgi:hypothetical protein
VPWFRKKVASLSPRKTGFAFGSAHVAFVVDKVAQGQVVLRDLRFSPANIIPPRFSIFIYVGDEQGWLLFNDIASPH